MSTAKSFSHMTQAKNTLKKLVFSFSSLIHAFIKKKEKTLNCCQEIIKSFILSLVSLNTYGQVSVC